MTESKVERIAYARKIQFDHAIWDHADKLSDAWTNADGPRRPLSRAHELLHPGNVRQAIVQWCLEFAREYYPGTISNPTDERRVAQLYREGKINLPELPCLHRFLNSWTLAALSQGYLVAWALDPDAVATGKRRQIATDRWQILQPDFKQGAASIDDKPIIYGIEVEVACATARSPRVLVSRAKIKKWFVDYMSECEAAGKRPNQNVSYAAAQEQFADFADRTWFREMRQAQKRTRPGRPRKLAG